MCGELAGRLIVFSLLLASLISKCWQHLVPLFSWIEIDWSQYSISLNRWNVRWQTFCSVSILQIHLIYLYMTTNFGNHIYWYLREHQEPIIIPLWWEASFFCGSWLSSAMPQYFSMLMVKSRRKVPHKRWNQPSTVLTSPFANLSQKLHWIMCWGLKILCQSHFMTSLIKISFGSSSKTFNIIMRCLSKQFYQADMIASEDKLYYHRGR